MEGPSLVASGTAAPTAGMMVVVVVVVVVQSGGGMWFRVGGVEINHNEKVYERRQ